MQQVQNIMQKHSFSFFEAQKYLALRRSTPTGKDMPKKAKDNLEVVSKVVHNDFTLAMVNYNSAYTTESKMVANYKRQRTHDEVDLSVFIVYDHRKNDQLEKVANNLVRDVIAEIKNIFVPL